MKKVIIKISLALLLLATLTFYVFYYVESKNKLDNIFQKQMQKSNIKFKVDYDYSPFSYKIKYYEMDHKKLKIKGDLTVKNQIFTNVMEIMLPKEMHWNYILDKKPIAESLISEDRLGIIKAKYDHSLFQEQNNSIADIVGTIFYSDGFVNFATDNIKYSSKTDKQYESSLEAFNFNIGQQKINFYSKSSQHNKSLDKLIKSDVSINFDNKLETNNLVSKISDSEDIKININLDIKIDKDNIKNPIQFNKGNIFLKNYNKMKYYFYDIYSDKEHVDLIFKELDIAFDQIAVKNDNKELTFKINKKQDMFFVNDKDLKEVIFAFLKFEEILRKKNNEKQ